MGILSQQAYEKIKGFKKQNLSKIAIVIFLSSAIITGVYLVWLNWVEKKNEASLIEKKEFPDNYHNAKDRMHMWACGGTKSLHKIGFSSEDKTQTIIDFYLDELSKPSRVLVDVSKEQDKNTKSHFTKIVGHDQVHQWIIFIGSENNKTWVSINETFLDKSDNYKSSSPLTLSLNNLN